VEILVGYDDQKPFHGLPRQRGCDGCLAAGVRVHGVKKDIVFRGIQRAAGLRSLEKLQLVIGVREFEFAGIIAPIGDRGFR